MSKAVKIFLGILAVIVVIVGVFYGKAYYEDRYVGEDYYALVPKDQPIDLVTLYDATGGEMGLGREYELIAYNEAGNVRTASFAIYDNLGQQILAPGSYVKFSLSKTIVVKHQTVPKEEVPQKVLGILESKQ